MWRAAARSLLDHKFRLLLTATGIALGVGLVGAGFMFTDSLERAFDELFAASFEGVDVQVRPKVEEGLDFAQGELIEADLVDRLAGLPGVERAAGSLFFPATVAQGETTLTNGAAPTFVVSWPEVVPDFEVRRGDKPTGADEVAIDPATAQRFGIGLGDTLTVVGVSGPRRLTVVGTASLRGFDSFGGTVSVYATLATVQELFGLEGKVATIEVAAVPGTDLDRLLSAIRPLLPPGIEAVPAQTAAEQQVEGFKEALGFITTFLLVFAGVAVFVAGFLIFNTFRILVAQRTRELALFRAIGATRGQTTRIILTEALVVGVISSLLGLGVGILLAKGIRTLLSFGGTLPGGDLVLRPRTALVGLTTGLTVTLVSALLPARAAGRVAPLAALREASTDEPPTGGARWLVGLVTSIAGGAAAGLGLAGTVPGDGIWWIGGGVALIFLGMAVLLALFTRPVIAFLGAPAPLLFGVPGRIARSNAVRSPRRTAATASALMIGLTLVGLVAIMADSVKATTAALLAERFRADLVVSAEGFGASRLPPTLAMELDGLDGTDLVVAVRRGRALVGGDGVFVTGADPEALAEVVPLRFVDGDAAALDGRVAVRRELADRLGVEVGDRLDVTFARTGLRRLRVGAIFEAEGVTGDVILPLEDFRANFVEDFDDEIFVLLDGESGRREVEQVVARYPAVRVRDQGEFLAEASQQVDGLVRLIFGLLGVAVVIALAGITNTLSLSVLERTRELGLLRAVGLTRRQLTLSILIEAALVASFGALVGAGLGIVFGWALVQGLGDQIVLSIPLGQLGAGVLTAAGAGIAAALLPAWRAARLNVLGAIAYE